MEHFTPSEAPIHETERLPVIPPRQIIGRNRVLGQVFAQVRAGAAVLLHGPDGVGKSALAATLAAAFTTFPGGVLWWGAQRSTAGSLETLIARLGRAYGEQKISDTTNPLAQTEAAAQLLQREHKPLIVLDDVGDLDVAREFVRKVAGSVPVIITSAEEGPGPWTPFALSSLEPADSAALFFGIIEKSDPTTIARANVGEICRILEHLPLPVTLAANHIKQSEQTPGDLLEALSASGEDGLEAILDVIFPQLPEALQGLLLTLGAAFGGSASAPFLAQVQMLPPETETRVMGMLMARGLVQRITCYSSINCYHLHPQIRDYIWDWLYDHDQLPQALERIEAALVAFATANQGDNRDAHERLCAELPGLLSLGAQAASRRDFDTLQTLVDALKAAFSDVGGYGYDIYRLESRLPEPAPEPEIPAEEAPPTEPGPAQMDLFEQPAPAPAPPTPEPPAADPLEAAPLQAYNPITTPEPEPPPAESVPPAPQPAAQPDYRPENPPPPAPPAPTGEVDDLLEASDSARATGDLSETAKRLIALGQKLLQQGRDDEAAEAFEEALEYYESLNDTDGMLTALESLAGLSLDEGDLDNAVVYATRAENLAAQYDDSTRHGHLQALLGDVRMELGELDEAINTYRAAVSALRGSDDSVSLGIVQTKLGNAFIDRGDFTNASTMLTEALSIFEYEGLPEYQGRVLGNLGTAYGRMGHWAEAQNRHRQALAIAEQSGDEEEQERQLANLAYTAQAQGDRAGMLNYYRQALALAYRTQETLWQVRYLDVLGRMLMDEVAQVSTAIHLMEEAQSLIPDEDRARLLNRAIKRQERIEKSGIAQVPPPEDIRQWAEQSRLE